MSRMLLAGMIGLGLTACSGALAGEPGHADPDRWQLGHRALDRTLVVGTLIEATIQPGAPLTATVSADVRNGHRWVVIPAGCPVGLRIALLGAAADKSRADPELLVLDVTSVTVWGQVYPVSAAVEETPVAVRRASREVVAAGSRVLFVLAEG